MHRTGTPVRAAGVVLLSAPRGRPRQMQALLRRLARLGVARRQRVVPDDRRKEPGPVEVGKLCQARVDSGGQEADSGPIGARQACRLTGEGP